MWARHVGRLLVKVQNSNVVFSRSLKVEKNMSVRDAINSALDEELERDERVFLLGEDVAQYDGPYKVTKGLWKKFGNKRLMDTPICEAGFCGVGIGAALGGLRPVVEFMSWNFALQAMDQLLNSAAKITYMSAGRFAVPVTFRGANGTAVGVAAQHSQCFATVLANNPGLKVVSPFSCDDARGLLKSAIRDSDPVCVLENEILYGVSFALSDEAMSKDFLIPIGKAKVERPGKDITIVGHSMAVKTALDAATVLAKSGIDCEVINLRTLRPLDVDTISNSLKKTHHLVTIDNGWSYCSIGEHVAMSLLESEAFYYFDAPPSRLTMGDFPLGYATNLELAASPSPDDVILVVKKVLNKK